MRRCISTATLALCIAALCYQAIAAEPPRQPSPLATTGPKPKPVETPKPAEIDASIKRGVQFLIKRQNANGSWGAARNTKGLNIYAPVPGAHHGFRGAVTSLCISALIETGGDGPEVLATIERGEAWMFENLSHVRRATPEAIYNVWCHAYAIQALVRMDTRLPKDKPRREKPRREKIRREKIRREKIRRLIDQQIDLLGRYECVAGGWCYYDHEHRTQKPGGSSIGFVTAAVLVALNDARQAGIDVPEKLITRGKASIIRQRNPDMTYAYGEYLKMSPRRGINRPGGSLGRSQACNVAMRLWGDTLVTDAVIETWLNRLFARNGWLDIGRKRPIPHESWFQVAGYFYYFGHYYAALCIDELPTDRRGPHQDQLAQIIMKLQEKDGCWWDYPLYDYHQQYGTALALMTLARCRRAQDDQ